VRLTTSLQVGAKYFGCVVCRFHVTADAGSAPCQKPASINLQKCFLSPTGRLNLGFILTENLPLCSSYLPLGVPNWAVSTAMKQFFWCRCRGERGFLQGESLASNLFTLLLFCLLSLLYFCLHFFQKYKKISSFIVLFFACLLLVLLE
jgi:hypothetical protein